METANILNFNRLILVLKRQLFINMKTWLIGLSAGAGLILLVALLNLISGPEFYTNNAIESFGFTVFFIGGLIITSTIFNELHYPDKSLHYLTLPASALEKLISALVISILAYVVVGVFALLLVNVIVWILSLIIFGVGITVFNPFSSEIINYVIFYYIFMHSFFFLGAVYFRKNNFIKTALALFLIIITLVIFTSIFSYFIIGVGSYTTDNRMFFIKIEDSGFIRFYEVFRVVLIPFLWIVAYFRLKEREV